MFAAMIEAVFFTDYFIKMFVRFTFGGATAACKTGLGVFARRIIFAVHVCTAIGVRRFGVDTCTSTFDKAIRLASLRFPRINTDTVRGIECFACFFAICLGYLAIWRCFIINAGAVHGIE